MRIGPQVCEFVRPALISRPSLARFEIVKCLVRFEVARPTLFLRLALALVEVARLAFIFLGKADLHLRTILARLEVAIGPRLFLKFLHIIEVAGPMTA